MGGRRMLLPPSRVVLCCIFLEHGLHVQSKPRFALKFKLTLSK